MPYRLRDKKKVALVLSGGGIKAAAFHMGVCLALREKGFRFAGGSKDHVRREYPEGDQDHRTIRIYVGSSAGAFISAILSAGYSLEALINAFNVGAGYPNQPDYPGDHLKGIRYRDIFRLNGRSILKSLPASLLQKSLLSGGLEARLKDRIKVNGLFSTKGIERYLREHALSHNGFDQLGVQLYVVGTQLNHSRKVLFGDFPSVAKSARTLHFPHAKISQAVAASVSLPPMFAPYGIKTPDGKELFFFDGEIRDTLSTHVASDHGADLVIASYSVQPYHFNPEIGSLHKFGMPVIFNQALYQVIQQKIERHISHTNDIKTIYSAIEGYFKNAGLDPVHREKILEIIRNRVHFRPEVDHIYIHPRPDDDQMFFADHFNLNKNVLEKIVRSGFKSAISALRRVDL